MPVEEKFLTGNGNAIPGGIGFTEIEERKVGKYENF